MSTVVGRYASPGPHAFACGSSESTGEYVTANFCAADSAPRAHAGRAQDKHDCQQGTDQTLRAGHTHVQPYLRRSGNRAGANPANHARSCNAERTGLQWSRAGIT